ncbi:hypothetical protein Syun_013780 [Stephania yunnanensis]|uniref:SHSP domain-containing protein n=1 Tax=Stephania yunnanensis TaxID=152371 RepID=A0AAP0JIU9_9MAGN
MELELGLKITRTGEESTSTDLRIAKDRTGPVFFSTETEKMFILTVHLKGFKREKIKIEINDDGTRIAISGERPIREMVLVRWKMYQKETEIVRFRKVFRIPNGVRLDLIKARFDEEDSILTISMPKSVKGIVGTGIEEIKEIKDMKEAESAGEKSETTDERNLTQNSPQREPERPIIESEQQPIIETPIGAADIGVEHETEEIIPERIQESSGEEIVRKSIENESKPPDPTFRSKETMQPPPPPPQPQPQPQEHEPNPQQARVEQIRSEPEPEPEPEPAVEQPEEQIQEENKAEDEEIKEIKGEEPGRGEAALDEQNLRSEEETSEVESEEEEEEEERGVESESESRRRGFGGPFIYAGSAALIGLLIVLVLKLLKKRKFKRKQYN